MATAKSTGTLGIYRVAKSLAKRLPAGMQFWLKDQLRAYRIRHGTFCSLEPEWSKLSNWIGPGDTVLDLGANAGHYTLRMSELAGPDGNVLAFEPIRATFRELSVNATRAKYRANIALVHAAVSDHAGTAFMSCDLQDNYRACIADAGERVRCVTIDDFKLSRVDLMKIDVEGHELPALQGARETLKRCKPRLIVECNDSDDHSVDEFLKGLGYEAEPVAYFERNEAKRSPNTVYS